MFTTVLIANRGEIAIRVIGTLRRLGIRSVAVYSDADERARHVTLADAAIRLGPAPASQSYLNIEAVIAAARASGAEAIHPGYGFLAENAAFARACEAAGITFIGPTAAAIEVMGDKISAKAAVEQRGVRTVPGIARPGLSDQDLEDAAPSIGYPLLIKPSAGGGGKGMHVVERAEDLHGAVAAARREARASFGDDALFIERYLMKPRHIEVQVLADNYGSVIHLGERECSLQRRHQKVIEEAPSPLLDEATRHAIGQAACETARSVDYRGAGTVEFLVAADRPDEFFFMEMNTRLQVEHPVTEQITGVDLVEQQLRIAAGEQLTLTQDDIALTGHSFEARVYAEDPSVGFLPTGGRVDVVTHPAGAGVRVDSAIAQGLQVSTDYDPMLAKIISWGEDREAARTRLLRALEDTAVIGFPTNITFLHELLEVPEVVSGELDTGLIGRVQDSIDYPPPDDRVFAEAALLLNGISRSGCARESGGAGERGSTSPWQRGDGMRLGLEPHPRSYRLVSGGERREVLISGRDDLRVQVGDAEANAASRPRAAGDNQYSISVGGETRGVTALISGSASVRIALGGSSFDFAIERGAHGAAEEAARDPHIDSPMPGTVVMVHAADGARVAPGDPVVVVEAMKMEHVLRASVAGEVSMRTVSGDQVSRGQTLAVIHADEAGADPEPQSEGGAG